MSIINLTTFTITLVTLLVLAILVASRNIKSRQTSSFIFFDLSIFAYIACAFVSELPNTSFALVFTRAAASAAIFIPLAFLMFSASYAKIAITNVQNTIAWIAALILAVIGFTPYVVKNIEKTSGGTVISGPGPLLWLTLVYFLIMFAISFTILFKYQKNAEKLVKQQIRVMVTGITISVVINLVTQIVLPEFHISQYGVLVGTPALLILVAAVAYAIFWHRMFDIKAIAVRTFGYLTTLFIVVSLFGVAAIKLSNVIFPHLALSSLQQVYFITAAVVLAFLFFPLQKFTARFTDKLFQQDKYNPANLIEEAAKIISSEINLMKLSREIVDLIDSRMKVNRTSIIVLDQKEIYYIGGYDIKYNLKDLKKYLDYLGEDLLVEDEIGAGNVKKILRSFQFSIFLPLKLQNEIIGYLAIGPKRNGSFFDNADIKGITMVANELTLAIQNSKAFSLIQNFNVSLQNKVNDATKELIAANEKLRDADVAKDDFISMASHQLTTPLAAIDGYVTMAAQGYYGEMNDKLKSKLNASVERINVMKSLINDLLNINRMSAGKFHLDMNLADLQGLITTEVDQHKDSAIEKKVLMDYHLPSAFIPKFTFDKIKMQQVISNFINNAIDYSPEGKINIYLKYENNIVTFKVVDNGIGVPKDQKEKLFTKFFRADNAKKIRPDGSGIGLYLSKRVIEDHGGKIIFESEPGVGSTFGFTLPIAKEPNT